MRDVLDIHGAGSHIRVLQRGKGRRKTVPRGGDGVFRSGVLGLNDVLNGIRIIDVIQEHLVDFKDSRVILAYLLQCLFVQLSKLLLGLQPCLLEPRKLLFRGQRRGHGNLHLRPFVNPQRAYGDAVKD